MSTEMASLWGLQDREGILQQLQFYVVPSIYYVPSENMTQELKD